MIDELREKPASATMLSMLATWNLIEAREILRIVTGRMEAITRFAEMADRGAREVPDMHRYFKKWPWIIDPAWTQWRDEARYSKVLAEAYPREGLDEKDRQMDFLAIGVGDTIHVVELKRPGHRVDSGDMDQLLDCVSFVEEGMGNAPGGYRVVAGYIVASGIRDDRLTRVRVRKAASNRRYVRTYEDLMWPQKGSTRTMRKGSGSSSGTSAARRDGARCAVRRDGARCTGRNGHRRVLRRASWAVTHAAGSRGGGEERRRRAGQSGRATFRVLHPPPTTATTATTATNLPGSGAHHGRRLCRGRPRLR